jgi:EamA domain-containing membrane protein RarD
VRGPRKGGREEHGAARGVGYPGVTVLLARVVLGERMRWIQRAGLVLAAAGILLVPV